MICRTNYPFSSILKYTIESDAPFKFYLRIPGWVAGNGTVQVGDDYPHPVTPDASGLHQILINSGITELIVTLPMEINVVSRNSSVGIFHGPLLYAADISYTESHHQPLNWTDRTPLPDFEVQGQSYDHVLEPTSPWKYAIDPSTISVETTAQGNHSLPNPVFTRNGPPISLRVDAYPIDWPVEMDTASLPPLNTSVHASDKIRLKLIPYGAAKLHIAQFPVARTIS